MELNIFCKNDLNEIKASLIKLFFCVSVSIFLSPVFKIINYLI